jgi:hypothetical protein
VETSLHRQLKDRFGPARGGRSEVVVDGYRIDAVEPDGRLVEVQSGALGPLRGKLARLLPLHRVVVVKPVVVEKRIVRRARADGPDLSARLSPRRGVAADVFDDLVGLARLFPHPNLGLDVLAVAIDEVRTPRRRWPGYWVADRLLRAVVGTTPLRRAADLWSLLPEAPDGPFTTRDLAERLGRPLDFAQRVAYCLRLSGAAEPVGKVGNCILYRRRPGRGEPDRGCRARPAVGTIQLR